MVRSASAPCRATNCGASLRGVGHFYCPGHWEQLLAALGETIERNFVEWDRDHLVVLHWSSDRAEIERLESELIRQASYSRKLENEDAESWGRWSGHWNCVYASWTWRNGSMDLSRAGFRRVDGLYHPRLAPDCSRFPKNPDYLKAAVSADRAARILDDLDDQRADWWERRQRRLARAAR